MWRQKASGFFSSFRSADQDWIDSSSRSPLTPALFLSGSELLAPLCTRRDVPADNLAPTCRYCPQAFQRCSESLLHLSLCCQSASEASLSLQFLRAPVTPPREEKKRHILLLQLPRVTFKGPDHWDKKESDVLSQCETGEYLSMAGRVVILCKPRQPRETALHSTLRLPC